MTITIILPRDSLPPPITIYSDPSCPSFSSSSWATFPDHSSPPYSLCSGIHNRPPPPPSALRPCICRLPTNYFCLLSLLHPAPMTTVSCFWVLTTGGTQAKQVKWTRALTQFGSEGFLCHPLLAFYHPLSLH